MRHHKSARAEMGYKSTPTCEIMRIGIRVNTPPYHFFDHHCKILYEGALWFRTWDQQSFWKQLLLSSVLSQSGFSPLVPLLCNMCWRRHCTKMTVQVSIVSLFIFFSIAPDFFCKYGKSSQLALWATCGADIICIMCHILMCHDSPFPFQTSRFSLWTPLLQTPWICLSAKMWIMAVFNKLLPFVGR